MATSDKPKSPDFQMARDAWLRTIASYPNLSGADVATAVALSLYLNRNSGSAWPSIATLARDTNRNRTTVFRAIGRLESLGLVVVVHGRGPKKSNRYRPALGNDDPATLKPKPRGKWWQIRNVMVADQKHDGGRSANRTSEEPKMNCGKMGYQAEPNTALSHPASSNDSLAHASEARPHSAVASERALLRCGVNQSSEDSRFATALGAAGHEGRRRPANRD
ncbi:MAG: helix-turn-helix domain-containing protein [Pseudorhodoplanes sp.]|nr:helix-turn-helix domain-containing protein [Pseudorhodoplanes sp.]